MCVLLTMPMEDREQCQISQNWGHRQFWAAVCCWYWIMALLQSHQCTQPPSHRCSPCTLISKNTGLTSLSVIGLSLQTSTFWSCWFPYKHASLSYDSKSSHVNKKNFTKISCINKNVSFSVYSGVFFRGPFSVCWGLSWEMRSEGLLWASL